MLAVVFPPFAQRLENSVSRGRNLCYPTFSLVMNSRHRSAAFVALNIDQSRLGGRGSKRDVRYSEQLPAKRMGSGSYGAEGIGRLG